MLIGTEDRTPQGVNLDNPEERKQEIMRGIAQGLTAMEQIPADKLLGAMCIYAVVTPNADTIDTHMGMYAINMNTLRATIEALVDQHNAMAKALGASEVANVEEAKPN